MSDATPDCGTSDGKHIFEQCTCGNNECDRQVCIWCELIVTPSVSHRVEISALDEYDLG